MKYLILLFFTYNIIYSQVKTDPKECLNILFLGSLMSVYDFETIKKSIEILNKKKIKIKFSDNKPPKLLLGGAGLVSTMKDYENFCNMLLNKGKFKNKRVLLSPHSATFTKECKERMSIETIQNIIDFFENKVKKSMIVK